MFNIWVKPFKLSWVNSAGRSTQTEKYTRGFKRITFIIVHFLYYLNLIQADPDQWCSSIILTGGKGLFISGLNWPLPKRK